MPENENLTAYLPAWLATFCIETASELQVPQDAVALLGIGAVSAAVNGGASVHPVTGWTEPVSLYTLTLLASGEGKSPVFARLLDPVVAASDRLHGQQKMAVQEQKVRNRLAKRRLKQIESKAMKEVEKGEIDLAEAVRLVAEAEAALRWINTVTHLPVRVLTDTSPAAMIDALQANEGRLVVASPEAEALLNFRGGSKEAVLKGFDGEVLTQARRTVGEISIERPVVNMMLAMQPTILPTLGQDMVNRGLMPRFLISYPDSLVGQRKSRTRLVSGDVADAYEENITAIVERYAQRQVQRITWDSQALLLIGQWREEIEPMMAPTGELAPIAAWASKVRGAHFVRLAALLAIANERQVVNLADATQAQSILRSLMLDARKAFGEMGASFTGDDLVHLMSLVAKVGPTFSKRDIMRKSNRFMADPGRCEEALTTAVEEGLIERKGRSYVTA